MTHHTQSNKQYQQTECEQKLVGTGMDVGISALIKFKQSKCYQNEHQCRIYIISMTLIFLFYKLHRTKLIAGASGTEMVGGAHHSLTHHGNTLRERERGRKL